LTTSRGRLSYLREQLESSKAQIAKQEKEKQEMKAMIEQLSSRAANLSQNFSDSSLLHISDDTDFVKVRRGSSGSEMSARISSDDEHQKQVQELKDTIKEKDDIIRARNKAVQLLMSKDDRQSENELLLANDKLKSQLDAVEKKLIELEEEKGSLQLKLLDFEENNKKPSSDQSTDAQVDKDELRLKISELTARLDTVELAREKEEKRHKLALDEKKSLQEMLDEKSHDLSNFELALKNSQSEIETVRHEYETVLRMKESEIVSLQIELEDKSESYTRKTKL